MMTTRRCAETLALFFLLVASCGAADVRQVRARVVDAKYHQPEAGVAVTLIGLDRGPMTVRETQDAPADPSAPRAKGWKFVTNAQGRITVRFGKFDFWDHRKTTGVAEPGYGAYFLVAEKEGYAGGISPKLLNLDPASQKAFVPTELESNGPIKGEEWDYDARLLQDSPGETIDLVLQPGIDVSGQLLDERDQPIAGQEIELWNDLGADTHTGRGGEIFQRTAETDRHGRFRFHHVYPNLFHLAWPAQESDALCWLRTRVRDRWVEGVHDAIWPHAGETDLPLVIVASRVRPFHYFGRVADAQGHPIVGATVRVQASLHGPGEMENFEDSHGHYSEAKSGADGHYDVAAAGAYVSHLEVTAPGYREGGCCKEGEIAGFDRYDEAPCSPGRYDFTLEKK